MQKYDFDSVAVLGKIAWHGFCTALFRGKATFERSGWGK